MQEIYNHCIGQEEIPDSTGQYNVVSVPQSGTHDIHMCIGWTTKEETKYARLRVGLYSIGIESSSAGGIK